MTGERVLLIVMATTMVAAMYVPFTVMRDRMEGSLEFLVTLPARPAALALARFLAAPLNVLPGSLAAGVVFALVPDLPELGPLALVSPWQFALGFWLLLALLAWCLTAGAAHDDRMLMWPLVAMIFFVGFGMDWLTDLLGRLGVWAALERLFAQPYAGAAVGAAVGAFLIGVALAAFALTCRAFARYEPKPDRPL